MPALILTGCRIDASGTLGGEARYFLIHNRRKYNGLESRRRNWKQMKGKVKEQWGKLTNDDLDQIAGKREQLEGKIQERYGIERDRVRRDIDEWYGNQTRH